jgi:hypothetical protein
MPFESPVVQLLPISPDQLVCPKDKRPKLSISFRDVLINAFITSS